MKTLSKLGVLVVLLSVVCSGQAPREPTGHLFLKSVKLNDFLQTANSETIDVTVTCHTLSAAGRGEFAYDTEKSFDGLSLEDPYDFNLDLLPHESVECELTESIDNEEQENSHGFCEFTYARFLAPEKNSVTCKLSDGSSFVLRMQCDGGCPDPVPPPEDPYCKRSKRLLPTDTGRSHAFTDGSPGFALYAPGTTCAWIMPRSRKGVTNFLFSRLDLGSGDVITAYASPDGKERTKIKEYDETSTPESVSTDEEYLILELKSDGADEGLGFAGYYYYSKKEDPTVAITPAKDEDEDSHDPPAVGRKLA